MHELSTGLKFTGLFARSKIESISRFRTAGEVATPAFAPNHPVSRCGGAATEPHTFIASPKGVRHWPTYSFNARARVHSLQPVLRPSGSCSKAFRAFPFRCIAQLAGKCTNGCRRTHRSGPHEYRAFRHCRIVLEPRLNCSNPRRGETGSTRAQSAIRIGKTACSSE